MKDVITKAKNFICSEDGEMVEYLARIVIIGLGSTAVLFGVLAALRIKGGELTNAIDTMDF